ncbi:transcription factor bHLH25-like [Silene latifolia]|uniref:transcription factor bHLH25-like n=1 Tax=Silene latifolia TaxID=37657 RepID=UPI003D774ED7
MDNKCGDIEVDQVIRSSSSSADNEDLPVINVRFSGKSVLIKITCMMQKGITTNIMNKVEDLNLTITTANTMLMKETTLNIAIIAEMDEPGFESTIEDIVRGLRSILK